MNNHLQLIAKEERLETWVNIDDS